MPETVIILGEKIEDLGLEMRNLLLSAKYEIKDSSFQKMLWVINLQPLSFIKSVICVKKHLIA